MDKHDELCEKADVGSICDCSCAGAKHAVRNTKGGVPGAGAVSKKAQKAASSAGKAAVINNRAEPADGKRVAPAAPKTFKDAAAARAKTDADDQRKVGQTLDAIGRGRKAHEDRLAKLTADNDTWARARLAEIQKANPGMSVADAVKKGRQDPEFRRRLAAQQEAVAEAKRRGIDTDRIVAAALKSAAAPKGGRVVQDAATGKPVSREQAARIMHGSKGKDLRGFTASPTGQQWEHPSGVQVRKDPLGGYRVMSPHDKPGTGPSHEQIRHRKSLDDALADAGTEAARLEAGGDKIGHLPPAKKLDFSDVNPDGSPKTGVTVASRRRGGDAVTETRGKPGDKPPAAGSGPWHPPQVDQAKVSTSGDPGGQTTLSYDGKPLGSYKKLPNGNFQVIMPDGKPLTGGGSQPSQFRSGGAASEALLRATAAYRPGTVVAFNEDFGPDAYATFVGHDRDKHLVTLKGADGATFTVSADRVTGTADGKQPDALAGGGKVEPGGQRDATERVQTRRGDGSVADTGKPGLTPRQLEQRDQARDARLNHSQGRRARVDELRDLTREQFDKLPAAEQQRAVTDLKRIIAAQDVRNAGRDRFGISAKTAQAHHGRAVDLLHRFTAEVKAPAPAPAPVADRFDAHVTDAGKIDAFLKPLGRAELVALAEAKGWESAKAAGTWKLAYLRKAMFHDAFAELRRKGQR